MVARTGVEYAPEMDDLPWMIEFTQSYVDGLSVKKRGLDATPMVMRKYEIEPDEVMSFSTHDSANRSISVFHFHPDFPFEKRRRYMEKHNEGYEVARDVRAERRAEAAQNRKNRQHRLSRFGKSIAVAVHSMLLYFVFHHPDAR